LITPVLYIVATPIGNLADFTFRAVEILQNSHYILCEDTRTSKTLLNHYAIQTPVKSYHKFNEKERLQEILADLRNGLQIALISDAGTPGICDPGVELLTHCQKEKLPFSSLPGPCALILALTLSGMPSERFQFIGFLPKKEKELKICLVELLTYSGVSICYESPHRLLDTLALLPPDREIAVVREMTKIYEESRKGTAQELLVHFQVHRPKGEIVLLIQGEKTESHFPLDVKEHVLQLQQEFNLSLSEAIKLAASLRSVPKREIYALVHNL
jgi:16S rRNA (cytidine1402-2'-O)-methyltransferase